jgi:hypothetical protein
VLARLRPLLLASVYVCVSGCTSLVRVDTADPRSVVAGVKPGEAVVLTTRAGARAEIVVSALDDTSITGSGVRYSLEELQSLEVRRLDNAKTGLAALIVGYVVLVIVIMFTHPGWVF